MASARENDLNPDIRIGLKLPFNRGEAMSTWLPYIDIAKVDVIQNETNPTETKVDIDFSLNYEPNRFNSITLNFDTTSGGSSGDSSGGTY